MKSQASVQNQSLIFYPFLPATQTSIHKGQWIEYHPLCNITDTGPIEFNVSGTGEEYLDLARMQLYVKAKDTKANGTALDADTQVGTVNLSLHSLFSQMEVSLNERPISAATNTYRYRTMIESFLNYGEEVKTSQLSMSMFCTDTAGKMGVVNPLAADDEANIGLKASTSTSTSSTLFHKTIGYHRLARKIAIASPGGPVKRKIN